MRLGVVVLVLVLVATGCGSSKSRSETARVVIEKDWEGAFIASSDPFPHRPQLAGLSHVDVRCADAAKDAPIVHCTLVASAGARRVRIGAEARFDSSGTLRGWTFLDRSATASVS